MNEERMKKFAIPALIGLVLVGLVGSAFYQSGWSQGYMLGMLTSGGDNAAAVAPYMMRGGHHFGFIGGIFRFAFTLLFIGLLFKAFRCIFWRMGGHRGHYGGRGGSNWDESGPRAAHWHSHHGPHSPWGPQGGAQDPISQTAPRPAAQAEATGPEATGPEATDPETPTMYV